MNVELPDGTVVEDVPDNITKVELATKLKANGMTVPDEWLKPAKTKVGPVESAARTAAQSAIPVVRSLGLAAATVGRVFGKDAQEAVFAKTDELVKGMEEMYAPKPDEEFNEPAAIAGGIAALPIEMVGGLGLQHGIERATQVVKRGGTMGEAATAGGATGAVRLALNLAPIKVGGKVGQVIENRLGAIAGGAATGGAIGVAGGAGGRAIENVALPEGKQYEDLQQEQTMKAALLDTALGAVLGGGAGAVGARAARKAKAEAPGPFPADKMEDLGDGNYRAPNGSTITKEAWDTSSKKVRDGWMAEEPKPAAEPEAAKEPSAADAELKRIQEEHPSGPVAEVARQVAAEREKATRIKADAEELRRAAHTTTDADLRAALLKRADKMDPPEKIPVGEAKEGAPEPYQGKKIPVGEVKEGLDVKTEVPKKGEIPVGKATEMPEPYAGEKIPEGEATEVTRSGVQPEPDRVPAGETKELYIPPEKRNAADQVPKQEGSGPQRQDGDGARQAAEASGGDSAGRAAAVGGREAVPPAGEARPVEAPKKPEGPEEVFDLGLPKIDESMLVQAKREPVNAPTPSAKTRARGIEQVRAELEKGRADKSLDSDGVDLALWALDKNPGIARNLHVQIESPRPDGAKGAYSPTERIVKLVKGNTNAHTAAHEITHHTERMMPLPVQRGIQKEWRRAYEKAAREATGIQKEVLADVPKAIDGDMGAYKRIMDAFQGGILDRNKHYQLINPSEFWAVNAPRILSERFTGRGSWRAQAVQWMREFVEKLKSTVGLRSDAPVIKALDELLNPKVTTGRSKAGRSLTTGERLDREQLSLGGKERAKPVFDENAPAEPGYVYHATNIDGLQGIEDSGKLSTFKPSHGTDQTSWPDGGRDKRAYFGASPKAVGPFRPEGPSVLLRAKQESAKTTAEKGTGDKYTTRPVRAEHLEYLGDDGEWHRVVTARKPEPGGEQLAIGGPTKRALPEETKLELAERKMFDRFNRVAKLQDVEAPKSEAADIVGADVLFQGRAQHRGDVLERDFIKPLGAQLKAAKKADITMQDADDYLMALHAFERNREIAKINPKFKDGGSGLMDKQAQGIIDSFTPEQKVHLDKIADTVHRMNKKKLDDLVADGLIKPEVRDALNAKYKKYVPLKTLDQEDAFTGVGQGYSMRANDIVEALGRGSKAGSPIAASIMDASRGIIRGEKARVDKSIWEYASDPKAQDFVTPYEPLKQRGNVWVNDQGQVKIPPKEVLSPTKDKTTGQVKMVIDPKKVQDYTIDLVIGGEQKKVFVPDQLLRDQIKKLATTNDPGKVLSVIGRGTGAVGRMLTEYNPAFTVPNAVRDAITIGVRAKAAGLDTGKTLGGIPAAWATITKYKVDPNSPAAREYKEFLEQGGKVGAYGIQDVQDTMRRLQRAGAELGYSAHKSGATRVVKNALKDAAHVISLGNEVMEYAGRFSAYQQAKAAGKTPREAAKIAKEITVNFNRSGEYGRTMNSVLVFANAALQGLRNSIVYAKSPSVRRNMLGIVALGAAAQAYNEMVGGVDEETQEPNINTQNDAMADKNVMVLMPNSRAGVKIPLPPEYSWLFAMGRRMYRGMSQGTWAKDAAGIVGNMVDAVLPVRMPDADSGALAAAKAVVPTLASPYVDIWTNQNYFGQPIVPQQYDKTSPPPSYTVSRSTTSDIAKGVSHLANLATGGDKVKPGYSEKVLGPLVSPEGIEHIVGFYTGGIGQLAMQSKNLAKSVTEGKPVDVNKLPIANRFIFEEPKSYTSRRYHELKDDFDYARDYQKAGTPEKIDPKIRRALPVYQAADRELGILFKRLRTAKASGQDPEAIQKQIKAAQSRVIRAYNGQATQ